MKLFVCLCFLLLVCFVQSCGILKDSPKYGFTEGYYKSRLFHKKDKKVYVVPTDDSVKVYSAKSLLKENIDSVHSLKIAFPSGEKSLRFESYLFRKNTFDVDVLTILFKYRPAVNGFPRQLNTTFNGAAYFGYPSDVYQLSYRQTPLRVFRRRISHYGYSFGAFTGIGTARIDPFDTNGAVTIEYDGVVWTSGLAAIVGVNNLSLGLTTGIDHLLDPNGELWVNQHKPWIGISFGLNLN